MSLLLVPLLVLSERCDLAVHLAAVITSVTFALVKNKRNKTDKQIRVVKNLPTYMNMETLFIYNCKKNNILFQIS